MNDQTPTSFNKLDLQLRDYLTQHTNHALLLTAGWGAGKTYYLKNHFFKKIQDTDYEPVLVSLFGIKSIDDIKDKIITELYPILENKYFKASKTILKTFLKSADITKLFGEGILASMVDEVSTAKKELKEQHRDVLRLDKLLICFDDLERASPELLTGSEILGFINSLVEDNNIKVIVVANEGVLHDEKYLEVKEKTIGETIHFASNFNDTFLSILEDAPQSDYYKQFLKQHQEIIHQFLSIDKNHEQGEVNYRTLTHFIARFSQVYQFIESGLKTPALEEVKSELLLNQLKFSLFIINEYKKGFFTFFNRRGFDDEVSLMMKRYVSYGNKEPVEKSMLLRIADAYFPNEDFIFYNAVYDYFTGGDFFDKNKLLSELKQEHHVIDDAISPAYQVYNKLSGTDYQQYSDTTFKELTRKMKNHALSGDYLLHDYVSVFYYVFRHGNVLGLNEDKFLNQLLTQIRKKKYSHAYNPLIEKYVFISVDGEFYRWSLQLREEILRVNIGAGSIGRFAVVRQMEHDLVYDYPGLHERLIKEANTPFGIASFSGVSARKFASEFQKAENDKKSMMLNLLRVLGMQRQANNSPGDFQFLKALALLLNAQQRRFRIKNISGYLRSELIKTVESSIADILPYQPVVLSGGEA